MIRFLLSLFLLAALSLPAAAQQYHGYQGPAVARTPWYPGKILRRGVRAVLGYPVQSRWFRLDLGRQPRVQPRAQVQTTSHRMVQRQCAGGTCRMTLRAN